MIQNNLPILQVLLPLIIAPICAVIRIKNLAWLLTCITTFAILAISITITFTVYNGQPIHYNMGNWNAPFGIEYRIDLLNSLILLLISSISAITSIYGLYSVQKEIDEPKQPLFYAAFLMCISGLLGITITNDAFNIYVFLEISSLATYALIAMGKDRRALLASFEYLILGTIGATFILISIGLLYSMTGTLNISDLSMRVPNLSHSTPIKAALAFFTVGVALKIAIFPLHVWLVNSYTNAPSIISVFLSATATKVGIYVLMRGIFSIFGYNFSIEQMSLGTLLITFSIIAIIIASTIAIFQHNIKRMLAYSSVAQIGYIILGISIANETGTTAALIHLCTHAVTKATLFMAAGCIMLHIGGIRINDLKGIGKTMPITMAAFTIAGLSLIGVPLTGGFISKFYLFTALLEQNLWPICILILFSSLLALIYIWRIVEVAYFNLPNKKNKHKEAPITMLIPTYMMAALTIGLGVYPTPLINISTRISQYLFNL